ncbi:MAG: T9SS type A sorting domain-containing protein [Cyclobacteriaceae bacterium]|nr:T9SS type A sorting domain-containing protein [Cyclobacteriaceae bacterium]
MKKIIALIFATALPLLACATHMRCGYISVKRLSGSNLTCRITITVYTNTGSPVLFGGESDLLFLGDGSPPINIPETPGIPLGLGIAKATYTIDYTYPGPGQYAIAYSEPNRNGGILNFDNSISTLFYIETTINLDPFLGSFDTPDFLFDPFFSAKVGEPLSLSIGAFSAEDHIISYELSTPKKDRNQVVQNYRFPENIHINPYTGLLTWDTKFQGQFRAGEFLFAVKIHLSKVINGNLYRLCTVERDIQIILTDHDSGSRISLKNPLDENNRVYIPINESRSIKILYEPNDQNESSLSVYSSLSENEIQFSTYDSSSANIKVGLLTLTSSASIDRDNPYVITIRGRQPSMYSAYASDLCLLFYTRDLYPEIITRTEDTLAGITVTPNPVTDFLKVQLPHQQPAQLTLLDLSGKMMLKKFMNESCVVDVRELPAGLYIIELRTGRARRTLKIIKH